MLFITGYAEHAQFMNVDSESDMEVLAKPFDVPTLVESIRALLKKRSAMPGKRSRPDDER